MCVFKSCNDRTIAVFSECPTGMWNINLINNLNQKFLFLPFPPPQSMAKFSCWRQTCERHLHCSQFLHSSYPVLSASIVIALIWAISLSPGTRALALPTETTAESVRSHHLQHASRSDRLTLHILWQTDRLLAVTYKEWHPASFQLLVVFAKSSHCHLVALVVHHCCGCFREGRGQVESSITLTCAPH